MLNYFQFLDKSDPDNINRGMFNYDDITWIEETYIPVSPSQESNAEARPQFVLAIYTRSNVMGKKSNCLVLSFENKELRDRAYAGIAAKLNPTTIEAKWFPV